MSHHAHKPALKDVFISLPWELSALSVSIVTLGAATVLGHPLTFSLWLLSLLVIGIAQAFLLATPYSLVGGLAISATWVLICQNAELGVAPEQYLLEMFGLVATMAMAIRYRGVWQAEQAELKELRSLRRLLVDGEAGTGLVSRSVAELRLLEESERAETSQRLVGVLLIEINKIVHPGVSDEKFRQASKAIERKLVTVARSYDLPFRAKGDCIGIILPERDWQGLQKVRVGICQAVRNAVFMTEMGQAQPVMSCVRLGIGWFESGHVMGLELLTMAEHSLQPKRTVAYQLEDRQRAAITRPLHEHLATQNA